MESYTDDFIVEPKGAQGASRSIHGGQDGFAAAINAKCGSAIGCDPPITTPFDPRIERGVAARIERRGTRFIGQIRLGNDDSSGTHREGVAIDAVDLAARKLIHPALVASNCLPIIAIPANFMR